MKTEYGTHLALGGTRRTSINPYLPSCFLHYHQPCFSDLLERHSRFPQNRYPNSKDQASWGRNSNKRDGCWNCPSSNVNLDNSLKKKCTYFHFSKPIILTPKPVPPCKASHDILQHGRRQLAHRTAHDFIVSGLNCRLLWQRDLPLLPQMRRPKLELHVYLPSEKDGEGVWQEMEHRLSGLSLQNSTLK
ncbi:hypothetical protein E2320_000330 [Naja naja]|nr:hypothetical protein E2320_000330 [Naja naja]